MNAERMRVLQMLEQGTINAAEAAELLHALEGEPAERARPSAGPAPAGGKRPRWFRVRVTDTATGHPKANVAIPYSMVDFGLRLTPNKLRLRNRGIPQVDDLLEALRTGRRGTLYDITDKNERERIEIIVE